MAVLNRFPQHADRPHFVYRAFDADDRLLYVGCTIDVDKRRRKHGRTSSWAKQATRWTVERFATQAPALLAEQHAIETERPQFNAMYNGAGLTGWNDERRAAETCLHGHVWAEHGFINAQGRRVCRECRRDHGRRHDAKRRQVSA